MYIPNSARHTDAAEIRELIDRHPLATVMTYDDEGEAFFSHLPVITRTAGEGFMLIAHLASRNPQCAHFKRDGRVRLIFHGPSAYISPRWYLSGRDVPTWNYAVVHVEGQARLIENDDQLIEILKEVSARFDEHWNFELPTDLASPGDLARNIVGIEVDILKIDSKFKLAQSRPQEDRANVVRELEASASSPCRDLAGLMKRRL